jgi:hypothetical protein
VFLTLAIQIMSRDGSWGQHFEVMAAAALFQVYVVVHQPEEYEEYATFGNRQHPHIYLQNKKGHYEWMRPYL